MPESARDFFSPEANPHLQDKDSKDPELTLPPKEAIFDKSVEVNIVFVDDSFNNQFTKEKSGSAPGEPGRWQRKTVVTVYIDKETGIPLDIWPGHPKAWCSCSGKLIFNSDQVGICSSIFHASQNKIVKIGTDGKCIGDQCICDSCLAKKNIAKFWSFVGIGVIFSIVYMARQ